MLTPLPFALQASAACVPHAELALSLAAAFHDVDAVAVDARIEQISAQLAVPEHTGAHDELEAVADLLAHPSVPVSHEGGDVCCLMLDDALESGRAHPLTRAILAIEVGRRHGIDVGLVSNGTQHCVAHERLEEPLLLCADSAEIVEARELPDGLQWHCSHEACGLLLDELEQRWVTWTRFEGALLATSLRLRLPLDDESMAAARMRRAAVQARLN